MSTLFEYLKSEFSSFEDKPLNPVDSAIFSQAVMLNGERVVAPLLDEPTGAVERAMAMLSSRVRPSRFSDFARAELFDDMFTGLAPQDIEHCLFLLLASPRFRDIEVRFHRSVVDEATHTQFGAMSFTWRDEFSYVAFRGTDAPFVGWRENLDMAYKPVVRSQTLAMEYLESVAARLPGKLHVGGHSKGGNLALFAALTCSECVRDRIACVWCHDAPGFKRGVFTQEDYERLAGRVHVTVPQDGVVGMLLDCPLEQHVVQSDAAGIEQHNVFSWEVTGDDFRCLDAVGDASRMLHDISAEWLESMDDATIERVVEAVSKAVEASGARDALDVLRGGDQSAKRLIEVSRKLDPASSEVLGQALRDVANLAARRLGRDAAAWLLALAE